ncbi:glycosyltransferase family 2 protein [Phocaeicola coprophilus]|mgnify:CR=1 FL=1|jgi:glycosyltransferase involved in cell wall biosynthesis|uniref:glycosyltransferase family 2 protein n=1 Tax=Phocaeicola coprophilus TaxID=387090 RepID=UPI0026DCFD8E|nr:glycosyltransferase family 2 protein [Phocaeicola coprophilus]
MKISIITISYNAFKDIESTILSVINQTYPNIEYIIIDGGSTDGTVDIIKKYESKISYWISEPDNGIYDAMNKGIQKATGQWINFMNAGDSFYNNKIVETFTKICPSQADIVYGDTMIRLSVGNLLDKAKPIEQITKGMVFGHQATFIKTDLHKKMLFDTKYKSSGDYNFFYQAYKHGYKFAYIPIIIANYEGENGISIRNIYLAKKENGIIQGKSHNILWNMSFYTHYGIYKIKKLIKLILPAHIILKIKKHNIKLKEKNNG